jgi:carboxypeptidase T
MRLSLFLCMLISTGNCFSQSAKLKIWLDPISESLLQEHGFELDHGTIKPGHFIINDFSVREVEWLDNAGVQYETLVEDLETYYVERNLVPEAARSSRENCLSSGGTEYEKPDHFRLGMMGGFFTYEEFLENLDSMAFLYPDLITQRAVIDTFLTHENRPIYWLKISDNPSVNEAEPEVLYTAIHHAREPQSLSQLLYFMWYVLENYGQNDEITYLVDHTEMYFIPMINPDGYNHNQTTNANGGGLWRKNKRDNLDGEFGVDLNRNYGFEWGYDNNGSSPTTSSQTYRGPSAFSEPETKAVKWLCEQNTFSFALNYHAHGNYVIYPWGYITAPLTPDSSFFIRSAQLLTAENSYIYGTGYETVGYAVNGDSDDWMYGEQTAKNKIFSMTPEVGTASDGFWPVSARIVPLSQENVRPNMLLSHLAGMYVEMQDKSPATISSTSGVIDVDIERLGLQFDPNNSYTLEAISSNIVSTSGSVTYTSMNIGDVISESFPFILDASIQAGDEIVFGLKSSHTDFTSTQEIVKVFGSPTVALSNPGENMDDFSSFNWSNTDEEFVSPSESITDSPSAFYGNSSFNEIEYERIIDMRNSLYGYLSFQAMWHIEGGWDYVQLLASPVDQEDWSPLCGLYTREGTPNQDEGQPLWDGLQSDWVAERVDLNDYAGQRIKVKFRLVSDQFVTYDGYYFDDLEFITLHDASSGVPIDTGYIDSVVSVGQGISSVEAFSLFPNPAKEEVHIESSSTESLVEVFDINGKRMLSRSIQNKAVIKTGGWEPGFYIVRLSSRSGAESKGLVVLP